MFTYCKFFTKIVIFTLCLAFAHLQTNAQLTTNFSATPLVGCAPLLVSYTDLSTGNPVEWRWDLGNGTQSVLQNPSTTYFTAGTYNVKLVIKNAAGVFDSVIRNQYITVYAKPNINFLGTPLTGCVPLNVVFTNQSTAGSGSIASLQWDFGDGTLNSQTNPSHIYTASGLYNVSLNITNTNGCTASLTKPQYIRVASALHANFTNTQPLNCTVPSSIVFTNASTGSGTLSYQWFFGDGGTSTSLNPTHIYTTAGSYTVKLIVNNNLGCTDTLIRPNAVSIGVVNAAFTNPNTACVNTPVSFTNSSAPVPTTVLWSFGDGTFSTAISPSKTYTSLGNYTVKMVANFGNCADSVQHPITILPEPNVNFVGSPRTACSTPLTVNFTNFSLGGQSYLWDFGDGATSTLTNPSHTYTTYGNFTVKLTVTNSVGCSKTVEFIDYISVEKPIVTIDNLPISGCASITHTFNATIVSNDVVVGYLWDFGDGTTSTAINPTHTFGVGNYNITVTITTVSGCTATTTINDGIIATTKPTANFSATPRDVCAYLPVQFTDLSTGIVTRWYWTFGDGGTSIFQNPTHVYTDTGYFTVTLVVWNQNCPDTIRFLNYIHIKPPIANFTTIGDCVNKFTKTMVDGSIGADTWDWNFGDGNTSTLQNPVHTYADTGHYVISLTVYNNTTGCSYTTSAAVDVINEHANFRASDTIICKNNVVTFDTIGITASKIASYNWTFGDGGIGTGTTPTHTYTAAGNYTVQLIITDNLGCNDTLTKLQYIRVNGPTANFGPITQNLCLTSTANFSDSSVNDGLHPITTWTWGYGDGTIVNYTAPPFSHTYANQGTYDVWLKVVDNQNCFDSIYRTAAVLVSKPVAAFSMSDTLSCKAKDITFTNASTGDVLTYSWDFGDASTSTATNPTHFYLLDSAFSVRLITTNANGCKDTAYKILRIESPTAKFLMSDSITTCPPLIVNFTNTSAHYNSTTWNFGDSTYSQSTNPSHYYSYPGVYHVWLTTTSVGGCIDSSMKTITIKGPQGNFTYGPTSGCKPLAVNFSGYTQNTSSFIWDLSEGSTVSTPDSNLHFVYNTLGAFVPKMILVDTGGCQVPINGIDTVFVKGVTANFNYTPTVFCDRGTVQYVDSSYTNDGLIQYQWYFGDGGNSILQNPSHQYNTTGIFYPHLKVTSSSGCVDTITKNIPIKIVGSPQAQITSSGNGCTKLTATFNGSLLVPDTSIIRWNWDLANGNTSTLQNPPAQLYTTAGIYPITLYATNSSGCIDTVNTSVEAYAIPVVKTRKDTIICLGNSIQLSATGADNYTWSPANLLSCTACTTTLATPRVKTTFYLTGTSLQGCSNYDSVTINIQNPFVMSNGPGHDLCVGGKVQLYAGGAKTYAWSPTNSLNFSNRAVVTASPTTTTTYRVIGTDSLKCFNDTAFIPIKVYNIPKVYGGKDTTIIISKTATLHPTISSDVTSVIWSPTSTIVSNAYPNVVVKPNETTTYLVEVKNAGGCTARSSVTVNVICDGSNVFIPNTFSPNRDGMNDVFYPRGTGLFTVKQLRIFDRWGQLVFEKVDFKPNDASVGWDGTFKGVQLPSDVFVYSVDIQCNNNSILTFKGNIALIR
jgi:gliding motility-associated-like protein